MDGTGPGYSVGNSILPCDLPDRSSTVTGTAQTGMVKFQLQDHFIYSESKFQKRNPPNATKLARGFEENILFCLEWFFGEVEASSCSAKEVWFLREAAKLKVDSRKNMPNVG